MSHTTLKWLRLVTPGVIVLIYASLLGRFTGLWDIPMPSLGKATLQSLAVLVPGAIYYVTRIRYWSNEPYFQQVTGNLRAGLVRVSGFPDDLDVFSWRALRGVFFHMVDADKSLSTKASIAYFNGYIWTTLADLRVLSFVFAGLTAPFVYFGETAALLLAILFLVIGLVTFPASAIVTRQHIAIGNEQLEIIEHYYVDELKKKLEAIRARPRP